MVNSIGLGLNSSCFSQKKFHFALFHFSICHISSDTVFNWIILFRSDLVNNFRIPPVPGRWNNGKWTKEACLCLLAFPYPTSFNLFVLVNLFSTLDSSKFYAQNRLLFWILFSATLCKREKSKIRWDEGKNFVHPLLSQAKHTQSRKDI